MLQIKETLRILINDIDDDLELLKRQNYYERLGVSKNATFDEIRRAFRKQQLRLILMLIQMIKMLLKKQN